MKTTKLRPFDELVSLLILTMLTILGCQDTAKIDYGKCVSLNVKGDVEGAWKACEEAVRMDPTTESGKAAATLLGKLKPTYEKMKAERAAAEAKAAQDRAEVDALLRAERAKSLRLRVQRKYYSDEPDSTCTGKGLPPYKWEYAGGTYAEDAELAAADGCVAPYDFNGQNTEFCCPKAPSALGF